MVEPICSKPFELVQERRHTYTVDSDPVVTHPVVGLQSSSLDRRIKDQSLILLISCSFSLFPFCLPHAKIHAQPFLVIHNESVESVDSSLLYMECSCDKKIQKGCQMMQGNLRRSLSALVL